MCVLSIKVPIRKKSGNLFNNPGNSVSWCEPAVIFSYRGYHMCKNRCILHPHPCLLLSINTETGRHKDAALPCSIQNGKWL